MTRDFNDFPAPAKPVYRGPFPNSTFKTQNSTLHTMALPYKVATLLYCFNERDEVLLLERAQEPNRGLWSPCGGKLKMDIGESPYVCGCREAQEEIGLKIPPSDLHLTGLVSEHGHQGQTHSEGRFQFLPCDGAHTRLKRAMRKPGRQAAP
jgi:ADP-ribose pyrophosphatase